MKFLISVFKKFAFSYFYCSLLSWLLCRLDFCRFLENNGRPIIEPTCVFKTWLSEYNNGKK